MIVTVFCRHIGIYFDAESAAAPGIMENILHQLLQILFLANRPPWHIEKKMARSRNFPQQQKRSCPNFSLLAQHDDIALPPRFYARPLGRLHKMGIFFSAKAEVLFIVFLCQNFHISFSKYAAPALGKAQGCIPHRQAPLPGKRCPKDRWRHGSILLFPARALSSPKL